LEVARNLHKALERNWPPVWQARAIRYQRKGFRRSTLITSLLDTGKYAADEIVSLYRGPQRPYPRAVEIKMSAYNRKPPASKGRNPLPPSTRP
jgi:hypothetical protein